MDAPIYAKRWAGRTPPEKILAIRFHALGDTVITLPYLKNLKKQFPHIRIDFLTRSEVSAIPRHIGLFENVFALQGGRSAKSRIFFLILSLPYLLAQNYDAVLDLQNNKISRIIRRFLRPKSWASFDVYSPIAAGERTKKTIEALWQWRIFPETGLIESFNRSSGAELLHQAGHRQGHEIVILNPAGFCESRNWPLSNYVAFARKWIERINPQTQFVLLLLQPHQAKSKYIKDEIGDMCIDLTGKADQVKALEIIAKSSLMLSEDSGLMHMAWTQGIPTIALFSSSRREWSAPQGERSLCLDSGDLACGPCLQARCIFNDNRCLTRYTADFVLEQAMRLRLIREPA